MNILLKFTDTEVDHDGEKIPVVVIDMASEEDVREMSEPTPAMWTAATVYELFITGQLNEMTHAYMAAKQAKADAAVAEGEATGG